MQRKESKGVLEGNGPVPQKEELGSGQLTLGIYIDFVLKGSADS